MEWYWIALIIFVSLCVGWAVCAIIASGKIADLELELRIETQNKEHWKKKTWELIDEKLKKMKEQQ